MPSFVGRLAKDGQPASEWLTFTYNTMRSGDFVSYPGTIDLPEGRPYGFSNYNVLPAGPAAKLCRAATITTARKNRTHKPEAPAKAPSLALQACEELSCRRNNNWSDSMRASVKFFLC
jgi:hypothetical protein